MPPLERKSKEERREDILNVVMAVFAEQGLHGALTEEIAKLAGISQPYVFRLFGTKKQLFVAVVARWFAQILELMQHAAEGQRPLCGSCHQKAATQHRSTQMLSYAAVICSADSSTNTRPPEFANPTGFDARKGRPSSRRS